MECGWYLVVLVALLAWAADGATLRQSILETAADGAALGEAQELAATGTIEVRLPGSSKVLTLCEVQAFENNGNRIPLSNAQQSSTLYLGAAGRAIDGITSTTWASSSCTHSAAQSNPWWKADYDRSKSVDKVVIYNRADCCSDRLNGAEVFVGGTKICTLQGSKSVYTCSALVCPKGTVQVGDHNADIGGCGLTLCQDRHDANSPEKCRDKCNSNPKCVSFSYAPVGGSNGDLQRTVCTLYDKAVPTGKWGPNQIMCANKVKFIGDRSPSKEYARQRCTSQGYGLCKKADIEGFSVCAAGYMEDFKGYWMDRTISGCGVAGFNGWSEDNIGVYCCRNNKVVDQATINQVAKRYAPLFLFDRGATSYCLPENPQEVYECKGFKPSATKICGSCNADGASIDQSRVQTFVQTAICDTKLSITYWVYYSYQKTCDGVSGSHKGDWERVNIEFSLDLVPLSVRYYQHNGFYKLDWAKVSKEGEHPKVFVGKKGHGSYHDSCDGKGWNMCTGGCFYYDDFRNPSSSSPKMKTWENVAMFSDILSQDWVKDMSKALGPSPPLARNEDGAMCRLPDCESEGCQKASNPSCWGGGTRCGAGTTCNKCCNGYKWVAKWWPPKHGHFCK